MQFGENGTVERKQADGTDKFSLRELYNGAVEGTYFDARHMKLNAPKGRSDGHYETSRHYLDEIVEKTRNRVQPKP